MPCKPDDNQCVPESCDIREAMAEAADALENKKFRKNKPGINELATASEDYVRE